MDLEKFPIAIDWARKHIVMTVVAVALGLLAYGTYSFIGGYAGHVGEESAGENYAKLKSTVAHYVEVERI
ncbi:MAG TPA: hypothetical protein VNT76_01605, partial [Candidatus Binatus sp.]|nr:hypothetical protein [Candidatus Binatus sp.]